MNCNSVSVTMLCRSTAYDRKRHFDIFDGAGYVGAGDVRSTKESRVTSPSQSESLMTSDVTGSALPLQLHSEPTLY